MRGLYYMWLSQLYGDVPLYTSTSIIDDMQLEVSAESVIYPQIIADFVSGMNQVQHRAGVSETGYTLENVQNERRWEFAMEGLRFNDMRRWSGCRHHHEDSYAARALGRQRGQQITCHGKKNSQIMEHMTCSWEKRYADT